MCSASLPRSVQLYTEAFGFADAGGMVLWGERVARIQGLGDDTAGTVWWLVGRQDFVQLEFFNHVEPAQRPFPAERRPCDLGWTRFGIAVPDFDDAIERLRALGVPTLTEPVEYEGLRRVCFRDPYAAAVVEVLEEGEAMPGGVRPRFFDLVPAVVYATVSVADLEAARRFFLDTLGLAEQAELVLHPPELESLWGLAGARRESFVARGGDLYVEVVRYDDPVGRPMPEGQLLSDQGLMNVAVGFRDGTELAEVYERVEAGGYRDNFRAPRRAGGTYVHDGQGNTVELLVVPRELDAELGFAPRPVFGRPSAWPRPAVGPAEL